MDRDNRINFLVLYEIYSAEFGFLSLSTTSNAESLRIAYTSIAVVYGPLWTTQEAEIFKKHGMIPPGDRAREVRGSEIRRELVCSGFVDNPYKERQAARPPL